MYKFDDTIAAISTPRGSGGIAVIRMSGRAAISIADKIYKGKISLKDAESHRAHICRLIEAADAGSDKKDGFLDESVVTVFRTPRSYTKEDVVEISCHGGQYLVQRVLELLLKHGARLAEPGEFTQRAFLNGRIDLSQAEAVADIIRAKTELSLRAALSQFQGVFSDRIKELRQKLIDICSLLELELDFAEEDVNFAERNEINNKLMNIIEEIRHFLSSYDRGKILRDGVKLVITGKPNVGKSSLLNAILKEERAIVTEIPGTTRDILEEQVDIRGLWFRVVDTAGIRDTIDKIEREGVNRTRQQLRDADIVLLLFDGSQGLDKQDWDLIDHVCASKDGSSRRNGIVAAINKIDLGMKIKKDDLKTRLGKIPLLEISAKCLFGMETMLDTLVHLSLDDTFGFENEPVVTNIRQKDALQRARSNLELALTSLRHGLTSEFIALDLRAAMDCLGEIIGEVTTEDILSNIFSKFCIGK
jgi:tRNA modification GTPase